MTRETPPPDLSEKPPASSDDDARGDKKERVLHTRVPAVLETELKRFAQNLRIPVSNLVRTILEDAMQMADAAGENVETRLKTAALHLEHERARLKLKVTRDPLRDVVAFQRVTVAQPTGCSKCAKPMDRGELAYIGVTDQPLRPGAARIFVCDGCLPTT